MFDIANLPYWIFLAAGILLFVVSISIGGEDELDGDGFDIPILGWLGIGQVPLMLLLAADLSLWGLFGWVATAVLGVPGSPLDWLVFVTTGGVSVFLGGAIARPLGRLFFASFSEDSSSDRLVGCLGTVNSPQLPRQGDGKVGQVDVVDPSKNLVTVNVVIPDEAEIVPQRGDTVLIVEHCPDYYLALVHNSIDCDRWLGSTNTP
ncbi:YqiJ family protein [Phormidium yuhuli AB48]|uniref:YqiJ family protein n=1 Tax=Phormidium yuhuli AB48 TaxID=2940671 RepID=A0ABY5ATH4_9CYAN|nr:OB-fold-containig protein [Phormidium yuhuli]USR92488.1 YqiJ family protein [Phormidium yuhuli AB48]